jgi:hypothetical protein
MTESNDEPNVSDPRFVPSRELCGERKRRARDRFKVVAGDFEDRAATIRQVDAWRAEVDKENRKAKASGARLMARRGQRRAANPRPEARHVH